MRIVFLGSGAFALPTLRWLAQSGHQVPLVITQPARPSGRGRKTMPTPVRGLADELGWAVLEVADVNDSSVVEQVKALDARVGLVIAFGQKLGGPLIASMPGGLINLHASLLPKYRGAAPINWALIRGEERTGCTVFRIVERLDAGPILSTRWTAIKPDETAGELHDRLAGVGVDAVDAALKLFEGGAIPEGTPQSDAEATRAPKLAKSDGFIQFDRLTREIARQIAGVTPWPGATARYESAEGRWERVTITRARSAEGPSVPGASPGAIDARRYVATSDGFLEILEIKPSSGRVMSWEDYVNGRHVKAGDMMTPPK
jgi:methionyl-tRNA formyltransferase